jgi:hypothetical protein
MTGERDYLVELFESFIANAEAKLALLVPRRMTTSEMRGGRMVDVTDEEIAREKAMIQRTREAITTYERDKHGSTSDFAGQTASAQSPKSQSPCS